MTAINKQHWVKPYRGPFEKKEAEEIAKELNEGKHFIARVRARSISKKQYDVYVKIKWNE